MRNQAQWYVFDFHAGQRCSICKRRQVDEIGHDGIIVVEKMDTTNKNAARAKLVCRICYGRDPWRAEPRMVA
jgi:hypothetical protein